MSGPRVTVVSPSGAVRARLALLHSNGMCAENYGPLAERLAGRGIRCALVDLPGFAGVVAPTPLGWEGLLDHLEPVLTEALGDHGALVGHSLGGLVSVLVADRLRLGRLVLMEPAIVPWRWLATLAARRYVDRVFDEGAPAFTNRGPWFWRLHAPDRYPQGLKDLVHRTHAGADPGMVAALQRGLPDHYPLALGRIEVPTLVVRGASSGPVMALGQRDLVRRLPNARSAVIPRAGHWMVGEQDDLLAEVLGDFVLDR